ncbi:MAG TPA: hypothetical protein PLU37_09210 [Chitinophagaceae bacterium]|nr:hypothetical protein [Bacteroidales bacterium]MDD3962143.1 hypothetical protein [Bacteroidales bacterium]MDY0287065.1 hypothetical protein [Bacteroidales bacterium]HPG11695.1 hypothetical protein [Chitinophagaceae bacterium]
MGIYQPQFNTWLDLLQKADMVAESADGSVMYLGFTRNTRSEDKVPAAGTELEKEEGTNKWALSKVVKSTDAEGNKIIRILWADGLQEKTHTWAERETYSYSYLKDS